MEWLKNFFGIGMPANPPTVDYGPAPRGQWPSQEQADMRRQYDADYGSIRAGFVDPRPTGKMPMVRDFNDYTKAFDATTAAGELARMGQEMKSPQKQIDRAVTTATKGVFDPVRSIPQPVADQLNEASTAAQYSALASLGFDPRRMSVAQNNTVPDTNILGFYGPVVDRIVTNGRSASTPVHESVHRGLEVLRNSGMWPQDVKEFPDGVEESIVRATMLKNFGNVEQRGDKPNPYIEAGRKVLGTERGQQVLDSLENAAAQLIAQRNPRGPR